MSGWPLFQFRCEVDLQLQLLLGTASSTVAALFCFCENLRVCYTASILMCFNVSCMREHVHVEDCVNDNSLGELSVAQR